MPFDIATVFSGLDLVSTAVFALSGALAAARKKQTIVTFIFFATATGVGGGTLRDLLIDVPVFWVANPAPLVVCLAMAGLAWFVDVKHWPARSLLWLDAAGLAALAAFGASKALGVGTAPVVAVAMGVFTATAGGIIRDVLAGEPSVILGPEIYVSAAAVSASVFVLLAAAGVAPLLAGGLAAACGFGLRAGAIIYGWRLPAYKEPAA